MPYPTLQAKPSMNPPLYFLDPGVRSLRKGFGKIVKTCELAKRHGLKYVWVDTCCIDKTSSADGVLPAGHFLRQHAHALR